jgi:hypothetical protein
MSQQNLRRSLAVFAFATLTTLSPLADLYAAPGRQGRSESGDETRSERRSDVSVWKSLQRFLEKHGVRMDGNGLTFAAPVEETHQDKAGVRMDGNG